MGIGPRKTVVFSAIPAALLLVCLELAWRGYLAYTGRGFVDDPACALLPVRVPGRAPLWAALAVPTSVSLWLCGCLESAGSVSLRLSGWFGSVPRGPWKKLPPRPAYSSRIPPRLVSR